MNKRTMAILLVAALVISLGTNVYLYIKMSEAQRTVNNIRAEMIVEWADRMDIAARFLKNATKNIDVAEEYGVRYHMLSAYHIMRITLPEQSDQRGFYESFWSASIDAAGSLIGYEEGALVAPITERPINATAIEMFGVLAEQIWNVTDLIHNADQQVLASLTGADPIQLLAQMGIRDEVVQGCRDIGYCSLQIAEFEPKFQ